VEVYHSKAVALRETLVFLGSLGILAVLAVTLAAAIILEVRV
jgi:hypothetical protein